MRIFQVYEDWTLEASPRCFYVGKGDDRRVQLVKRNGLHTRTSKRLGFQRVVIFETASEVDALNLEIAKIAEHHTYVHDPSYNGVGCNFTKGGDGVTGKRHTPESRARITAALIGRPCSEETRRKIGARTSQPIIQMTLDGHVVKEWSSITQAAETLGFARTKMSATIKRGKSYRGFLWRYNLEHEVP